MAEATILIAEDEPITRMDLREMVEELGYRVVGEAGDGWEAVQLATRLRPNVIIMDIKMPRLDGLVAAQKIADRKLAPVILLSAYSQKELVSRALRSGVAAYLVKPLREVELAPAIEIALARQRSLDELHEELHEARKQLQERKLIERAKGKLMQRYDLEEGEAYRQLQRISMDQRQGLASVSRQILESK